MTSRSDEREQFLRSSDWQGCEMRALQQDASFRRYFRLHGGSQPALLMDAPPGLESIDSFVTISAHLLDLGLSAPRVYLADPVLGLAILEDFGDATFTRLLDTGTREPELYQLATECLIALHTHPRALHIHLPRREASFADEVQLLCDWYWPEHWQTSCPDDARRAFSVAWAATLERLGTGHDALVLRDFHVDNAMLLPERSSIARCGLLDFQDAALGHAGYDLISLLEDARRDVAPEVSQACLSLYLKNAVPVNEHAGFVQDCAILAAQRHTRVLGVFARLHQRDGKPHYLAHVPRLRRLLAGAIARAELQELADWHARWLPLETADAGSRLHV